MGGLIRFMPFTYTVMLIGTIALLGLPWLSGFYSKDLILELAYGKYHFSSLFAFILGTLTAFLTAFYSVRLINLVYLTIPNAKKISYLNIHSENSIVILPLSILALFAIFLGFVASDFVGIGSDFLGNSLFYHPNHLHIIEAEFSLPLYIKLLPTILSLLGGGLAFYLYHYGHYFLSSWTLIPEFKTEGAQIKAGVRALPSAEGSASATPLLSIYNGEEGGTERSLPLAKATFKSNGMVNIITTVLIKTYTFLNGKYLLDNLYNNYVIAGGLKLGFTISKLLDKGIIELVGPYGLTEGSYSASRSLSKLDTGVITTYALYITLGLISLLFILFSLAPYDAGGSALWTNTLGISSDISEAGGSQLVPLNESALPFPQRGFSEGLSVNAESLAALPSDPLIGEEVYASGLSTGKGVTPFNPTSKGGVDGIKLLLLSIFSTYLILSI